MEWSKFLSFFGIVLGAIAAFFLSKVLFATAQDLLATTIYYSKVAWPRVEMISSLATPKADTYASIILILFALSLQTGALFVKHARGV